MPITSTTKEDKRSMVASSVAASATRKRNDGFIHGKPLVMPYANLLKKKLLKKLK